MSSTYVFDIWAGVNGNDIAVFDSQVVSHHTVDSSGAIIQIIIGQDDQNGIFTLLSLDEDCVTSEELESLHGVVGEGNDGVVIVGGICDAVECVSLACLGRVVVVVIYSHQGVWLLLLLQDGCGSIELLGICERVVSKI